MAEASSQVHGGSALDLLEREYDRTLAESRRTVEAPEPHYHLEQTAASEKEVMPEGMEGYVQLQDDSSDAEDGVDTEVDAGASADAEVVADDDLGELPTGFDFDAVMAI